MKTYILHSNKKAFNVRDIVHALLLLTDATTTDDVIPFNVLKTLVLMHVQNMSDALSAQVQANIVSNYFDNQLSLDFSVKLINGVPHVYFREQPRMRN